MKGNKGRAVKVKERERERGKTTGNWEVKGHNLCKWGKKHKNQKAIS